MGKEFNTTLVVSSGEASPDLDTSLIFDSHYEESKGSAIDEFQERIEAINKLAPPPLEFSPLIGQLVLLGVVAAVESYLRTLFRRIVFIDEAAQEKVFKKDVSYAAAMHLSKDMMPEAILEKISFISENSISTAIREVIGISGSLPSDLSQAIDDYVKVCQIRHCSVHRFGKLGASNAVALGLSSHKELLEKPLSVDYAFLQDCILVATNMVKTINNYLFNRLISRIPFDDWVGVYGKDRYKFGKYYSLFADTKSSADRTVSKRELYDEFMKQRAAFLSG